MEIAIKKLVENTSLFTFGILIDVDYNIRS